MTPKPNSRPPRPMSGGRPFGPPGGRRGGAPFPPGKKPFSKDGAPTEKPWGAKPERPWAVKPNKPWEQKSEKPWEQKPDKPWEQRPKKSWGAKSDKPWGPKSDKPWGAKPEKPWESRPEQRPNGYADRPARPTARPFRAQTATAAPLNGGGPARPRMNFDDLIYGIHAVDEALRAGERLERLHIGRGRERDPAVATLIEAARAADIPVRFENPDFFIAVPYKAHQSVVAVGQGFTYASIDEAIAVRQEDRLIVVLDHLTDPHNVGAILRTAECAGAQAVILPDRRSAGINATVRKAAAGATSHLSIAQVGNVTNALKRLKAEGFTIVGASLDDEARPYTETPLRGDIALVIGAEGTGLSRLVARNCDLLVTLPLLGEVASLNASVACGILLYEIVRHRDAKRPAAEEASPEAHGALFGFPVLGDDAQITADSQHRSDSAANE